MLVRKNLKPLELCHSINFIRIKMYRFNYLRRCRSSEWSSIEYFRWKIISFFCLAIYNKLNIYEHEHVRGYTVCLNDFKCYKNCTLLPFFLLVYSVYESLSKTISNTSFYYVIKTFDFIDNHLPFCQWHIVFFSENFLLFTCIDIFRDCPININKFEKCWKCSC